MFESGEEPPTIAERLAAAATCPPGDLRVSDLTALSGADLGVDEAITVLQVWERFTAHIAGAHARARAHAVQVVRDAETARIAASETPGTGFIAADDAVAHELAAALHVAKATLTARAQDAFDLAGPWQPLREGMLAGEVSASHAATIGRVLRHLPAYGDVSRTQAYTKQCRTILARVVPYAATHTPGQTRRFTNRMVIAADPAGARARHQDAAEHDHGVFLSPGDDAGTMELTAIMPTAHAYACYDAITTLAKDPRFEVADGCRTRGQRRVAAMISLMLGDPGSVGRLDGPTAETKIRAHVDVVVPLDVMTRLAADPGILTRLRGGTIADNATPTDVLLHLLADTDPTSTLRRLVTDPCEAVVDLGRTRYAISDTQRRLIEARDRYCRFPGCTVPANRCDIDHARAWNDGGASDIANLGALCRHHHQAKTHGGWQITTSTRDGTCTWQSPNQRVYHHQPPELLPPPPEPPEPDDPPPF